MLLRKILKERRKTIASSFFREDNKKQQQHSIDKDGAESHINNNNNNNDKPRISRSFVLPTQSQDVYLNPVIELNEKIEVKVRAPAKLVDYFFVVGAGAALDPIDDRYEYSPPSDPIDMIFKGELLDTFPPCHDDTFPPHIWMFCMPRGLQLYREDPGPSFCPFVLTAIDGQRNYGAVLIFHEILPDDALADVWKKLGKGDIREDAAFAETIYVPKCIGLLSHFPIYSILREWLNELYQKTFFSPSTLPIERYIYNLIVEVPMPIAGGSAVQLSIGDLKLNFVRPPESGLPLADCPFHLLFKVLDIGNVLTLFECILLEEKLVITSSHMSILTMVCEIMSALMYPFEWPHVYVPILPEVLVDFVYSPTPFIMGVLKPYLLPIKEDLMLGEIVIVDLDTNRIHTPRPIPPFPEKESNQLLWELQKIVHYEVACSDYPGYNPALQPEKNNNFANFLPPIGPAFDEYIRLAFLKFFASIFRNYRKYLMYLRVFPKPIAVFNKLEFLKTTPNTVDFMKGFMETQSFTMFLEKHAWPTSILFDDWIDRKLYTLSLEEISSPKFNMLSVNTVTSPPPASPFPLVADRSTRYEYTSFPEKLNKSYLGPSMPLSPRPSSSSTSRISPVAAPMSPSNTYSPFKRHPSDFSHQSNLESSSSDSSQPSTIISLANMSDTSSMNSSSGIIGDSSDPDDAKNFKTLVDKFLDMLFANSIGVGVGAGVVPGGGQGTELLQIIEYLKFDFARMMFGRELLNMQNDHKRLSESSFGILGEVLQAALREAYSNLDLVSPQLYLEVVCTYHRIHNGAQEYLFTKVRSQDIWQNHLFWEKYFFDKIEKECKKLYNNDIQGKMKVWENTSTEERQKIVDTEENMVFNLVFSFAFNMVNLSLNVDTLRRFVTKICLAACLNEEHTHIILQLVANMARGKEIEDEALGAASSSDAATNQETESKRHFSKQDNYLPVGMNDSDDHVKGNQMFKSMVDEKAKPLVGSIRSLSRKFTHRAKWEVRRSTDKFQDVASNSGDYVLKTFSGHKEAVLCVDAGVGGTGKEATLLVSGSCDGTLMVWDLLRGTQLGTLVGHAGWVNVCELEKDGSKVLSGSYDRSLKLWDIVKNQKIRSMRGHKGSISCLQVGVGRTAISGSYDNTLMLWDYRHNKAATSFIGHQGPVMSLLWEPDLNRVISGSRDASVRVWDLRNGKCLHVMSGHSDWVKCIAADGDLLLSGSCDGRVKAWSLDTGECSSTLQGHTGSVNSLQLWRDKDMEQTSKFITASADSTLKVWDVNYAGCYQTLQGHTDEVVACQKFLTNCVASASFDGNIRIWEPEQGKVHRTIAAHTHRITCMRVHESCIITGSWDKNVKVCSFGLDFRL